MNRLTEISNNDSSGGILNRFAYTYNDQDLRSSESRTNAGDGLSFEPSFTTYNHDALNQVLSATDPERLFLYDDDGNMTQGYTAEGFRFTASYDAENRLTSLEYTDSQPRPLTESSMPTPLSDSWP